MCDDKYTCKSCKNENNKGGTCCGGEMKKNNNKCDCGSGKDKSESCSDQ